MSTNRASPTTLSVDLTGRTVIVTGASSGIGHHIAGTLASNGATVVLGARRADRLSERVDEITEAGGRAIALPLDVCDTGSAKSFLADAEGVFDRQRQVPNYPVPTLNKKHATAIYDGRRATMATIF